MYYNKMKANLHSTLVFFIPIHFKGQRWRGQKPSNLNVICLSRFNNKFQKTIFPSPKSCGACIHSEENNCAPKAEVKRIRGSSKKPNMCQIVK